MLALMTGLEGIELLGVTDKRVGDRDGRLTPTLSIATFTTPPSPLLLRSQLQLKKREEGEGNCEICLFTSLESEAYPHQNEAPL